MAYWLIFFLIDSRLQFSHKVAFNKIKIEQKYILDCTITVKSPHILFRIFCLCQQPNTRTSAHITRLVQNKHAESHLGCSVMTLAANLPSSSTEIYPTRVYAPSPF